MRLFRDRGVLIAALWLGCQGVSLAVSPFAISCAAMSGVPVAREAADEDHDECCAGLAPGQMCPRHKHMAHGAPRTQAAATAHDHHAAHAAAVAADLHASHATATAPDRDAHAHHATAAAHAGDSADHAVATTSQRKAEEECRMHSTCDPLLPAIESLLSSAAVLPAFTGVVVDDHVTTVTPFRASSIPFRTIAPDLPPPRG